MIEGSSEGDIYLYGLSLQSMAMAQPPFSGHSAQKGFGKLK